MHPTLGVGAALAALGPGALACAVMSDHAGVIASAGPGVTTVQLAGRALADAPYIEHARAFQAGRSFRAGVDPELHPTLAGAEVDLYVVGARDAAQWLGDQTLTDVRPLGEQTVTLGAELSIIDVRESDLLSSDAGTDIGAAYDVVLDVNRNGVLDSGDFIDGDFDDGGAHPDRIDGEAGLYVCGDLSMPGPLAIAPALDYSLSGWPGLVPSRTRQRTVYPADIAQLDPLPLVVISHGNGHQYTWYDYLQQHLASYGYVVMAHQNDTVPGIETASTSTLRHTEAFFGSLSTIGGGVLDGRIDPSQVIWIGHSRGGEGVVRAYTRLTDGLFIPSTYLPEDIILVSSIAPNNSIGPSGARPGDVAYHLLWGAADGDISGQADFPSTHSFAIYERATGFRQSTYVHGADHNDFNCCGFDDFAGPGATAIGRTSAQRIARVVYLALLKRYQAQSIPALDYLTRQWEGLEPLSIPTSNVVVNDYKAPDAFAKGVIDNFQTQPADETSSSGGVVSLGVANYTEGVMQETSGSYSWSGSEPMNGMSRGVGSDDSRGAVFDFDGGTDHCYALEVIPALADFSSYSFLSFRACQGTRHPLTLADDADLTFLVSVFDGNAQSATIDIGAYDGGIEETYRRSSGWQNEFELIRIRVRDFTLANPLLDLTDIRSLQFNFGISGASRGRLGIDDIELSRDLNIPSGGAVSIVNRTPLPDLVEPGVTWRIDLAIDTNADTIVPGSPTALYRYAGGAFTSVPLTFLGGNVYRATFPAPDCTDQPEVYFSVEGELSGTVTFPPGGGVSFITPGIGNADVVFEDDFETDLGWTVGAAGDDASTGVWVRVDPNGTSAQPEDDHTEDPGTQCFVTGQGSPGGATGQADVDGGRTTLTSPVINLAGVGGDAIVGYWRWYSNDVGVVDDIFEVEVSNGGQWEDVETIGPSASSAGWVYNEFRVADFVTPNATVQVRFIASDEGAASLVEAALDDFIVFTRECSE